MISLYASLKNSCLIIFLSAFALSGFIGGCKDECKSSIDCNKGEQCVKGECKPLPKTNDSETATDDDKGSESESEKSSDDPIEKSTDTVSDTDSEIDTNDSDTEDTNIIKGDAQDGEPCERGGDCVSGYCQNNVCCASGYCCSEPGNSNSCPSALCKTVFCDGNFQCRYFDVSLGSSSTASEQSCDGQFRCDGAGNCLPVTYCATSPYKGLGTYIKEDTALFENCFETCTLQSHCNAGYECDDGICKVAEIGTDLNCTSDLDCSAGRCDKTLGVCCGSGTCCLSDEPCGRYACNLETRMCRTACRIDSSDNDSACSSLGDYHCDSGWCYEDLANGEKWCDENSDCFAGHCDLITAICCEGGRCCDSDDLCDGTRCLIGAGNFCPTTCAPEGFDDDTLCQPFYYCQDGVCLSGVLENGEECDTNESCISGRCNNGYCCDAGECCSTASDCVSDTLCNVGSCLGNKQCIYYAYPCASYDLDGDETCTGYSRCDGVGNCVAISECPGGYIGNSFACDNGIVASVCEGSCENDNQCISTYHCGDDGECVPNLRPGESGCDSHRECQDSYCNLQTGVCCAAGYCCNTNDQCAAFSTTCDMTSYACKVTCEEDEDCEHLGAYRCESGKCLAMLPNGDWPCTNNAQCLSGYCDAVRGVCCDAGSCCRGDADCQGYKCTEEFSCAPICNGDNSLCADGYFCEGDNCLPKQSNGGVCITDEDCISDHCDENSGICCTEGACCLASSDCDSGNPCSEGFCNAAFSCTFVSKADGESCSDGNFCNGQERCSLGVCGSGTPPCAESGNPCLDVVCSEEQKKCLDIPANPGQLCSEPLFCIGDVQMRCTDTGICEDPKTGTPPCSGLSENGCAELVCNEVERKCDETPLRDGTVCGEDLCEGEFECESGQCVMVEPPPCIDGNLCTEDFCEESGGEVSCENVYAAPRTAACGDTITLSAADFAVEVSMYNETCSFEYYGYETAFAVAEPNGNITVTVVTTEPETVAHVLILDNLCDAETCTARGSGALTAQVNSGDAFFVIETHGASPPSEMEVSVTCN